MLFLEKKDIWYLVIILPYYGAIAVLFFAGPVAVLTPGVALACCLGLCYLSFAAACITHNCMHNPCFADAAHEECWKLLLSVAYGHPVSTFVPGHNLGHHKFTQSQRDPMRTSKLRYRWHWLNLLLFQPTVAKDVMMLDMKYLWKTRLKKGQLRSVGMQWLAVVGANLALYLVNTPRFWLFFFIPHLFAQWAIVSMNLLQHDGCSDGSDGSDGSSHSSSDTDGAKSEIVRALDYNIARNFTGVWINTLTFNNGYHTAHHAYPKMHWHALPAVHRTLVAPHIHPNLDQPCMARYLWRTFVWPGLRVDYLGKSVKLRPKAMDMDDDWTLQYDLCDLCDSCDSCDSHKQ